MTNRSTKLLLAGLFAAVATTGTAHAQVTYTFVGRDYSEFADTAPIFSFTTPTFVSGTGTTIVPASALTSCTVIDASYPTTCRSIEFRPGWFGTDSVFFNSRNQFGDGASAYDFALGAFGAVGVYESTIARFDGPLVKATLTVSQALTPGVPEASTWAMMLLGFGAVGGALRWRRGVPRVVFG